MTELLALHDITYEREPAPAMDLGKAPKLMWLKLSDMWIDPKYQRPAHHRGAKNIKTIIEKFDWRLFSPLVPAPRPGHGYAIIDGQHRAIAAKMHGGIETVPCMVIEGDQQDEARAFAAINGQVTSILPTQIWHAKLVSGDADALALQEACQTAGVRVLRVPNAIAKPGDTLAIGTLEKAFKIYGRDLLVTAFMAVTESADGHPGYLRAPVIMAMCETLDGNAQWRDAGLALFDAIEAINLRQIYHQADAARAEYGGGLKDQIVRRLQTRLHAYFSRRQAVA